MPVLVEIPKDMSYMPSYDTAVDIGGTFTDVAMKDNETGRLWTAKVPSTPGDHSAGFMNGVRQVLSTAEAAAAEVGRVFHGTTIATNAVIERVPSKVGLITTRGFKYLLEIGRHDIPRRQNIYGWVKPPRPVTPDLILEVTERLDYQGQVLVPLDEAECREAARRLKALGVEVVAVCLLYSYADPSHERRVAEILRQELPEAEISLSSEVLPQFREYERTVATVLNAYVMPHISRYLGSLEEAIESSGITAPLYIMKSNGGVTGAPTASRQAIHTVLSGPVAGVTGALQVAAATGYRSFVSIDMGGTSADICLIRDAVPDSTTTRMVGGLPLHLPMLDIATIGAGGGSIARITATGGLQVGPESAGAEPGPACYGQGGDEPTVTDANLLLGRLPAELLGGSMKLDIAAAESALLSKIGRPLGLSAMKAAAGIVDIVNNSMAGAIRTVSVGRGHDPKELAMVAFGGSGPLHACAVAAHLGVSPVIVPPTPGVLSTYGLLFTDLKNDHVGTFVSAVPDLDIDAVAEAYRRLEIEAEAWLEAEGVQGPAGTLVRSADLRYRHQGWEITVDVPGGSLNSETIADMVENFHRDHMRLYTYDLRDAVVELVNLRVTAIGELPRLKVTPAAETDGRSPTPSGSRAVTFDAGLGPQTTPVYRRGDLRPGMELAGPAVIEQPDTTTLLPPDYVARVDGYGNLVIQRD